MVHWRHPTPLVEAGEGMFEASVDVPPGAYTYKFRLSDGQWCLDPNNPRTRGRDGQRNSLLVIDGATEPVLHAVGPPFVFVDHDARLCVRAGLRRSAISDRDAPPLRIRWTEGSGLRTTEMAPIGEEDEHLLYEAHLPVSAHDVDYWFMLGDGSSVGGEGGGAPSLRLRPSSFGDRTPDWWLDAVLYTIFVDRFRRGGDADGWPTHLGETDRLGGDLDGVVDALPHLDSLGVNALHLTPIGLSPSAHRYDAIDPRIVDPALGGDAALDRLIEAAHARDMRVLLDITVTHVHRDFAPFVDLRERGPASPYWGWFRPLRFPFTEGFDPGYEHYQKGRWDLPLLNPDNPEVIDWLVGTFEHWARRGVDGFRVDAAADVPLALVGAIREGVRAVNRDAVIYGELIVDNTSRWTQQAFDAATEFVEQQALYDFFWRRRGDAPDVAQVASRRRFDRGRPAWSAISFTATHDQPRLLSLVRDPRPARLAQLMVCMRAPVPALYYGDEVGLHSDQPDRNFEDAWPDRAPMPWSPQAWDTKTLDLCRRALALRRACVALRRGDEHWLTDSDAPRLLTFRRTHGDEIVDVVLHGDDTSTRVPLPTGAPGGAELLLSIGDVTLEGDEIAIGPWAGAIIGRHPTPDVNAAWDAMIEHSQALAGLAWRAGEVETLSLPAHLYVTVTERCNLKCNHCITHAPTRTRSGTARSLRPWLIEALAEPFAAAHYFGFSHGGESLTSPHFFDVLRAIGRARQGRPGRTDIHLLTNGMLLEEARIRRLIDHGITSLAISLDGATAATNNAIRAGGDFDAIVGNARTAIELRAKLGADLRIGISTVVTVGNVHELGALGALCHEIGADWLKIEETFPANPFARHALLDPRGPEAAAAMADLRRTVEPTDVVVVDHLTPPDGCRCDPGSQAFRRADDFANRATFNPCRMAWEQACVDPDGTVHPVDCFQPPLGNLSETPFLELWNGEMARSYRRAALASTSSRLRRNCPHVPHLDDD